MIIRYSSKKINIHANFLYLQEEVIVTTVGGPLSSVINTAAGPELQKELSKLSISTGDMTATKGYNLQAKHVLHCSLPKYGSQSEKVMI